jgi:hypothetical protein
LYKGKRNDKGGYKKGPKTGVKVRYYTKAEYDKLNHRERKELAQLRGGGSKNDNDDDKDESTSATVAALQTQVKELEERLIAAIKTQDSKDENDGKKDPLKNPLNQRS